MSAFIGVKEPTSVCKGNVGTIWVKKDKMFHCEKLDTWITEEGMLSDVKNGFVIPYNLEAKGSSDKLLRMWLEALILALNYRNASFIQQHSVKEEAYDFSDDEWTFVVDLANTMGYKLNRDDRRDRPNADVITYELKVSR